MSFGSVDSRVGAGQVTGVIELPTHLIACNVCSWIVVRAAPGLGCTSRLKYTSGLCLSCPRGKAKIPLAPRAA
jgi:hypothetical protein